MSGSDESNKGLLWSSMESWKRKAEQAEARLAAVLAALRNAGEWIAAVDPKLPMPGVGDSQGCVLAALAAHAAFRAIPGLRGEP